MELKRVVVTGLGALTPIGNTKDEYWDGLINGRSGAAPITYFDTEKFKPKFACEIKNYDPQDHFDRKEARKLDRFAQYALVSSDEAIQEALGLLEHLLKAADEGKRTGSAIEILILQALAHEGRIPQRTNLGNAYGRDACPSGVRRVVLASGFARPSSSSALPAPTGVSTQIGVVSRNATCGAPVTTSALYSRFMRST